MLMSISKRFFLSFFIVAPLTAYAQVFTSWEDEYNANKSLFARAAEMDDYGDKLFSRRSAEKPKSERWEFFKEYSEQLTETYRATLVISSALRIAYKSNQPNWEKAQLLDGVCSNITIQNTSIHIIGKLEEVLDQRLLKSWGAESKIDAETISAISKHLTTRYELLKWLSKTCHRAATPKNW